MVRDVVLHKIEIGEEGQTGGEDKAEEKKEEERRR